MATGYPYRPLKIHPREVRLLSTRGKPFREDEILGLRLEHWQFVESQVLPPYYAVSYIWGDHTRRKDISIDGKSVSVPENAEKTL